MSQATLFDISECAAEPWVIPVNIRRVEKSDWMRDNAGDLEELLVSERPNFSFLIGDIENQFKSGKISLTSIREWVDKKYEEAMNRV